MTQPAHCSDPGAIIRKQGDGLFSERQDSRAQNRPGRVRDGRAVGGAHSVRGRRSPAGPVAHLQTVASNARSSTGRRTRWPGPPTSATSCNPTRDVVVELIGGLEPAADWIRQALEAGKSVVTANKQVMAHAGADLMRMAGGTAAAPALRSGQWQAAFPSSGRCGKAWPATGCNGCWACSTAHATTC